MTSTIKEFWENLENGIYDILQECDNDYLGASESIINLIEKSIDVPDWQIMRMAEQAQRITELEEKLRWIPVSEQLPEKGMIVEGKSSDGEINTYFIELCCFDKSPQFIDNFDCRDCTENITHWREIPEL